MAEKGGAAKAEKTAILDERFAAIDPSVPKPRPFFSVFSGAFAGVGGFAFGYDLGVIGSILSMPYFIAKFAEPGAKSINPGDKSWIVNALTIGCAIGALGQGILADRIGRKWAIFWSGIVFAIGGTIQTVAENLAMMYVGRIVAGLSVGLLSVVCPMFMAETIEHRFRGRMITFQQLCIVSGISSAFWVDYIANLNRENIKDWSWRGPLAAQPIIAVFVIGGCLFLPRSPRWLLKVGRREEALKSLSFLRMLPSDNPYVQIEFEEMERSVELDKQTGQSTYRELLSQGLRRRLFTTIGVNIFQQLSGNNVINYYAPSFYQGLIPNADSNFVLLLQGFYGLLKLFMTFPTFFIVDRFGRKPLLLLGGVIMTVAQFTVATIFAATTGGDPKNTKVLSQNFALGISGVVFIWLFVVGFNASWGPVTWVYTSEIWPTRVRAKGMAVGAGFQWGSQFVIALIAPYVFAVNTFALFYLLSGICVLMIAFVWWYVPETKGITLEEMDVLFGTVDSDVLRVDADESSGKKLADA